ncbi:MAG TPA: glycosyltransferase family 39 protein [Rudaea sp.]|jgi:4-amino-4-deoxy-L-arabinose transferase-like glycosyltransferase|nr:glycosyltransferase family 39 protein [Rudaea sp.]
MRRPDFRSLWTATLGDGRWIWLLLILPVALFLPALPIDETRYLGVAWEMRAHGEFLVPHLNGAAYSDKPPLMFWLINIAWSVFGLNVWSVRLGVLAASLATVVMFERLVLRLDADAATARRASFVLMGMLYFALFSSAIMFDVLLTTWVLVTLHGAVDLDRRRWIRGVVLLSIGVGLGILTKGPVILLDAAMVIVFGAWWSDTAQQHKARWYGCLGLGILGGAAIGLAWAIPAAISGGPDYSNAIFFHQTLDRVTKSFAHRRPFWFYFAAAPFMVLPWMLVMRARWHAWRESFHISKSIRFATAWALPAFVAFCLVSGKQPHYLLPLLGALAVYLATVVGRENSRVDGLLFGVVLALAGIGLAALPFIARSASDGGYFQHFIHHREITGSTVAVFAGLWPLWGVVTLVLGTGLIFWRRARMSLRPVALTSAAFAAICGLALAQMIGPYIDVTTAANRIRQIQESGKPIAHLAWHHGIFEFAGRLTQPLPAVNFGQLHDWCVAHPDGTIVSIYTKYPIPVKPELEIPYRFGHISFWRASEIAKVEIRASANPEPDEPDDD